MSSPARVVTLACALSLSPLVTHAAPVSVQYSVVINEICYLDVLNCPADSHRFNEQRWEERITLARGADNISPGSIVTLPTAADLLADLSSGSSSSSGRRP
jgi:hypothetical protein